MDPALLLPHDLIEIVIYRRISLQRLFLASTEDKQASSLSLHLLGRRLNYEQAISPPNNAQIGPVLRQSTTPMISGKVEFNKHVLLCCIWLKIAVFAKYIMVSRPKRGGAAMVDGQKERGALAAS